jgi:hypothetical protein
LADSIVCTADFVQFTAGVTDRPEIKEKLAGGSVHVDAV